MHMHATFKNRSAHILTTCAVIAFCVLLCTASARAVTAPGTNITLTATASFTDSAGTTLSVSSNTITVTVQNAPSLTIVKSGSLNSVSPGQYGFYNYTLTNTGNAAGNFQMPSDMTVTGSGSVVGYQLNGVGSGTCSSTTPCALATLQTQLAGLSATAINGTITIAAIYRINTTATPGTNVQFTITANLVYSTQGGAQSETSANLSFTGPGETVKTDARLDLQATASTPGSSGAAITWTVTGNNGSNSYDTQDLSSAKTWLGAASNGNVIFDKLPSYGGTVLGLTATPTATLNGAKSGAVTTLYYSTAATPASSADWSSTYNANAKWLAVYISGGSGSHEFPTNSSGSTGAGSVSSAQITLTFTTNQPTGSGAGNTNAVTNMASSAVGGNINQSGGYAGVPPVIGQGVALGTLDSSGQSLNGIETNATSSSGTTTPGGASNSAGSQAYASYAATNGPVLNPDATGWYPGATGTPSADNMHDFTAYNVPCTSNAGSGVNGLSCTVGTNIGIFHQLKNGSNAVDTLQITATAPTGWKVQLYNANSCTGGGSTWPTGCTQGSSMSSQSADGGSVSGSISNLCSGCSAEYEIVYNATGNSATPFTAYLGKSTAAGQSGAGTGSDSNDTYDALYPGGVVKVTNGVSVTSAGCPAGESPGNSGACPGGTLSFTIGYANMVPAAVGSNQGTEPAFAYNACYTTAGSLVLTSDGAANPSGASAANNWTTYTNGIQAAATDTTANTVFTYYTAGGSTTTTFPGPAKLTAQVGGASYQLPPGGSGTVTFAAVVK